MSMIRYGGGGHGSEAVLDELRRQLAECRRQESADLEADRYTLKLLNRVTSYMENPDAFPKNRRQELVEDLAGASIGMAFKLRTRKTQHPRTR